MERYDLYSDWICMWTVSDGLHSGKSLSHRYPQAGKRKSGVHKCDAYPGKEGRGIEPSVRLPEVRALRSRVVRTDLPGRIMRRFCPCSVCMRQQDAFSDIIFLFT